MKVAADTTQRTRWGIGPRWGLPTVAYLVVAILVHYVTRPVFDIEWLSPSTAAIASGCLLLAGVCLWAASAARLRRGRRTGALVTDGPYVVMRHPLYAAWIFLILPAACVAFRSWIVLPAPVVAYVACRLHLPAEDNLLRQRHGEAFERYRKRTNGLLPTLPRWRRARKPAPTRKDP